MTLKLIMQKSGEAISNVQLPKGSFVMVLTTKDGKKVSKKVVVN